MSFTAFKNTTAPKIWPTTAHKVPIHRPSAPNLPSPTTPITIRPTRNLHPHSLPGIHPQERLTTNHECSQNSREGSKIAKSHPMGGSNITNPLPGGPKLSHPFPRPLNCHSRGVQNYQSNGRKPGGLLGAFPPPFPPMRFFQYKSFCSFSLLFCEAIAYPTGFFANNVFNLEAGAWLLVAGPPSATRPPLRDPCQT